MKSDNIILNKSFDFSITIIKLYSFLLERKEFVMSKQLLKAGTSIGANVEEAIAAQSRKDFVSKMSIASKEARETRYWLRLFQRSQLVKSDFTQYLNEVEELVKILAAIVKSSQKKTI